ncbi:MAG: heat-shock protein [Planctomycetota bacterium]|nr:MAG: heat-shock protein [Planctomycetota bacterium]
MNTCAEMQKSETHQPTVERVRSGQVYRPLVDIVERKDELLVIADVPGATPDRIEVNFERGELTLCAVVPPREREGQRALLTEYGVGDFCRTFSVSEEIDAAKITASYVHGVLTLHLPKKDSAKPRKIAVKSA